MLALIILVAVAALSLCCGGRLRYLERFELRSVWLAFAAFGIQLLIFNDKGEEILGRMLPLAYVATLAIMVVFLLKNRRVTGIPVLLAGLVLNLLVIGANGGYMPVRPEALRQVGQQDEAEQLIQEGKAANCILMTDKTHLNILGDYIVLPLVGSLGSAYSPGDLVALVGEAVLVFFMVRPGKSDAIGAIHD